MPSLEQIMGDTLSANIYFIAIDWMQTFYKQQRLQRWQQLSRGNVTMQGGQTLAGMQGTNNHMSSGSSQLMVPGFPLKNSQPYSPSRWVPQFALILNIHFIPLLSLKNLHSTLFCAVHKRTDSLWTIPPSTMSQCPFSRSHTKNFKLETQNYYWVILCF